MMARNYHLEDSFGTYPRKLYGEIISIKKYPVILYNTHTVIIATHTYTPISETSSVYDTEVTNEMGIIYV